MSKSTAEIRQAFLDFFHSKGHQVVASSSLVPNNDPTLLFTNAGMNQFKDVFLGLDKRAYSRATTSQRCVRAGGKHNDLENVGYTARHHTFFEMLGNFSFGDYFKHDAISYAWELLTGENWFNLPKERLWVTVYETDDEAFDIWQKQIGVPAERIIRIGDNKGAPFASDNFWQMGDTGPCGPCTEIFYDHGDHIWGGPPGSPEEDGDRYIEIWNIVFMQFNRQSDGTMLPLPKPSVDTGMGLERIAAVLQHVNSNYEIDLFRTLIAAVAKVTGATDLDNKSLRVIADHIRSCAFLVSDGVIPSNENRGYVLRRIIRRAIRHGNMLGAKDTFFYKLVAPLIEVMGPAADELKRQQSLVEQVLKTEEEQFARTLERGLALLDEELAKLQGDTLDGETAFRLYDTYGFPVDLTADVCRERGGGVAALAGAPWADALLRAAGCAADRRRRGGYPRRQLLPAAQGTGESGASCRGADRIAGGFVQLLCNAGPQNQSAPRLGDLREGAVRHPDGSERELRQSALLYFRKRHGRRGRRGVYRRRWAGGGRLPHRLYSRASEVAAPRAGGRLAVQGLSSVDLYRLLVLAECLQESLWAGALGSGGSAPHYQEKRLLVCRGGQTQRV